MKRILISPKIIRASDDERETKNDYAKSYTTSKKSKLFLPRLREDEKKNAGSFLKQKDNDPVTELLLIHNVHVTLDNIKRLDGDEWLNDCIINIAGLLI